MTGVLFVESVLYFDFKSGVRCHDRLQRRLHVLGDAQMLQMVKGEDRAQIGYGFVPGNVQLLELGMRGDKGGKALVVMENIGAPESEPYPQQLSEPQ